MDGEEGRMVTTDGVVVLAGQGLVMIVIKEVVRMADGAPDLDLQVLTVPVVVGGRMEEEVEAGGVLARMAAGARTAEAGARMEAAAAAAADGMMVHVGTGDLDLEEEEAGTAMGAQVADTPVLVRLGVLEGLQAHMPEGLQAHMPEGLQAHTPVLRMVGILRMAGRLALMPLTLHMRLRMLARLPLIPVRKMIH
jgi:hypothetical protein